MCVFVNWARHPVANVEITHTEHTVLQQVGDTTAPHNPWWQQQRSDLIELPTNLTPEVRKLGIWARKPPIWSLIGRSYREKSVMQEQWPLPDLTPSSQNPGSNQQFSPSLKAGIMGKKFPSQQATIVKDTFPPLTIQPHSLSTSPSAFPFPFPSSFYSLPLPLLFLPLSLFLSLSPVHTHTHAHTHTDIQTNMHLLLFCLSVVSTKFLMSWGHGSLSQGRKPVAYQTSFAHTFIRLSIYTCHCSLWIFLGLVRMIFLYLKDLKWPKLNI